MENWQGEAEQRVWIESTAEEMAGEVAEVVGGFERKMKTSRV